MGTGGQSLANAGRQCPADPRRVFGRVGVRGRGGAVPGRYGDGHRWVYPSARSIHRHRRCEADLRSLFTLGHRGLCLVAGPGRADGPHGGGHRDPAALDGGPRSERFDQHQPGSPGFRELLRQVRKRPADRYPQGVPRRRHATRNRRAVGAGDCLAQGCRLRDRRRVSAAYKVRASSLLHHRPGRGVVQSRPL